MLAGFHIVASLGFGIIVPLVEKCIESPEFVVALRTSRVTLALAFGVLWSGAIVIGQIPRVTWLLGIPTWFTKALFLLLLWISWILAILGGLRASVLMESYSLLLAVCLGWLIVRLYQDCASIRLLHSIVGVFCIALNLFYLALLAPQEGAWTPRGAEKGGGKLPTVVVVVFDEFPLFPLLEKDNLIDMKAFPSFAELAAQSNWYANATAVAGYTHVALPAIISGSAPRVDRRLQATLADFPKNIFTHLAESYSINGHEVMTSLCPKSLCRDSEFEKERISEVLLVFQALTEVAVAITVPPETLGRILRFGIDDSLVKAWGAAEVRQLLGRGFVLKRGAHDLDQQLNRFLDSIVVTSTPRLNFLHLLAPHVPYEYLANGSRDRVPSKNWPYSDHLEMIPSSEIGALVRKQQFLAQLQYTDRCLSKIIARLKETNTWDDALVIVTADHGTAFHPNQQTRVLTADNVASLALIPLFVKQPRQQTGTVNKSPVENFRVLSAIMQASPAQLSTQIFAPLQESSSRNFYQLTGAWTATPTPLPDSFDLSPLIAEQQRKFGVGLAGLHSFGFLEPAIGQPLDDSQRLDRAESEITFPKVEDEIAAGYMPLFFSGMVHESEDWAPRLVAIEVNGIVQALAIAHRYHDSLVFNGLLPESAFPKGGKFSLRSRVIRRLSAEDIERLTGRGDAKLTPPVR